MDNTVELTILSPLIAFMVFMFLLILMLYNNSKTRYWELAFIDFIGSLFMCFTSIIQHILIFSPVFETIFMLIQSWLFILASVKFRNSLKRKKEKVDYFG